MTTDAPAKVLCQRIADKVGSTLQLFQIRNGQPSGGTIGYAFLPHLPSFGISD